MVGKGRGSKQPVQQQNPTVWRARYLLPFSKILSYTKTCRKNSEKNRIAALKSKTAPLAPAKLANITGQPKRVMLCRNIALLLNCRRIM